MPQFVEGVEHGSPTAPHRAIITIQAEVHELMPGGQCRGAAVYKTRKTLVQDGQDRFISIRQLNELLQELTNRCQPQF